MSKQNTSQLKALAVGQLSLMQSVVCSLPNEQSIFNFVCRGLTDLPGVADASYSAISGNRTQGSLVRFPLQVGAFNHGELLLKISDPLAFAPYEPYLKNFCFMLAVILEERRQRRLIEEHEAQLEQRVQQRTGELETANLALRESNTLNITLLQTIPFGMDIVDEQGSVLFLNTALEKAFGKEAVGKLCWELYKDDRQQCADCPLKQPIHVGETKAIESAGVLGGRIFEISHTGIIYRGKKAILEIFHDITERKRGEGRLRDSEALYHSLVQNLPQMVFRKDLAGRFTFGNELFCRTLGQPLAGILGKTDHDFFPAELAAKYQQDDQGVITTGQLYEGEETHRQASGKMMHMHVIKTPLRDATGAIIGLQGIAWDVTEKKQLETQFLRVQRMESIGTLAGGIAHDLNNILAPILMSASMLCEGASPNELKKMVDMINTNAQRGADIIKQLLTFARGVEGERVLLQPKHLIREMVKIAKETFPKSIHLSSKVAPDLWPVLSDATQFHQVLLNLCINARDAMPDGGTLTVAAENLIIDDAQASMLPGANIGPHVVLQVTDTGLGIAPAVLDKIFDPFFTTKEPGKGTGLGLSTVLGIIRSHGGCVNVYSEVGKGTTFKVYLPARPEANAGVARSTPAVLPAAQGETILVVDDEPAVREMTRRILTKQGYQVLLTADGTEAVAVFARERDRIKLVLTDLMMPLMDGLALTRVLRKMDPQIKIIASTGLGAGDEQENRIEKMKRLGVTLILTKPYAVEKLLAALHETLRQKR